MEKVKISKSEPKKFSILCTFTVTTPPLHRVATNPYQAWAPSLYSHVYNRCPSRGITLMARWESPPALNPTTVPSHHRRQRSPQSTHRVAMATFWRTQSAQPGESGGCMPSPFHYIYHRVQSCDIRSS
jgi:hypothetical protein